MSYSFYDSHCHTEFAYCATDIKADRAIERSRLAGCSGIALVEHAGQLYLNPDDFWQARFLKDPGLIRRQREEKKDRMDEFKKAMLTKKSDFVRLGLEVECDRKGRLTFLEEDRPGIDFLIGAVHWLPEEVMAKGQKDVNKAFVQFCENLCTGGIAILAHPFRFFLRHEMQRPTELYPVLARLLRETGVAAELNFHTNQPDPKFFRLCLENGVKIATATDAHSLEEVGNFMLHLDFLKKLLPVENFVKVLCPGISPESRVKS